ncbi:MAG TPA: hypothetical protein VG984_00705 [Candidatus Paceibacterota bacterium]|nr:hypothetical protein [Candidatus Paceibacterota bacterium]
MNIDTLDTKGFVAFPYPRMLQEAVLRSLASWRLFCELPLEAKHLLSGGDRINDFGYMRRKDTSPHADDKEIFHALRANYPLLLPKARHVGDLRAVGFIRSIDFLITHIAPTVRAFAHAVEQRYALPGFTDEVMGSSDFWTFRFLRYPKNSPTLAHAHADRGGFTFHLCETEGGGEYLGFDKTWRQWPVSRKRTIIFGSMGLQYRSENKIKALWHRVSSEPTAIPERFAMVVFVDFQSSHRFHTEKYPHVQQFTPGFNYNIAFPDLAQYFIERAHPVPG